MSGAVVWLVEAEPEARLTGDPVPLRLGTRTITFPADDPDAPNRRYDGRLDIAYRMSWQAYGDTLLGGVSLAVAGGFSFKVDDDLHRSGRFALWRRCLWDGRAVRTLRGRDGDPYAAYQLLQSGQLRGDNSWGSSQVTVPTADPQQLLTARFATPTYAGTGGLEGPATAKGKVKPQFIGVVRWMEPYRPDPNVTCWHLDPVNGVAEVLEVLDGCNPISAATAYPPAQGKWWVDKAAGVLWYGGEPIHQLRVSARSGFAGGASTAGPLLAAVLARAGVEGLDHAAFATLGATAVMGWPVDESTTCRDLCDRICASFMGGVRTRRNGVVTPYKLARPAATVATDPAIGARILAAAVDPENGPTWKPDAVPPSEIVVRYRLNAGGAITPDRMAANAPADNKAFGAELWRSVRQATPSADRHPLAEPLEIDSGLDDRAAAEALAAAMANFYGVETEDIDVPTTADLSTADIAGQAWLSLPAHGIDAGAGLILRLEEDSEGRQTVTLRRWL